MKLRLKVALFLSLILIITLYPKIVMAQTDPILGKIFYNLNVDSSRASICREVKVDKRFKERIDPLDTGKYHISLLGCIYYGKVLDRGIIEVAPDSIDIQVSTGISSGMHCTDCNLPVKDTTFDISFIKLCYYYHTQDSLVKAYNNLLSRLFMKGKDTSDRGTRTVTNDTVTQTGERCFIHLNNGNEQTSLEITKMNLLNNKYSLEIEYSRVGN